MTLDDRILEQIACARKHGVTAAEIEWHLRPVVGRCVHQSVTGNLRHLVEKGLVVHTSLMRVFFGRSRTVYVLPEHYSEELHGAKVIKPRRRRSGPQTPLSERDKTRARVQRMFTGGAGYTCREIEELTGLKHQTVSARLNELQTLKAIRRTGEKRRAAPGERLESVYVEVEKIDQLTGADYA